MQIVKMNKLCIILMLGLSIFLQGCKISGVITYNDVPVNGIGVSITNGILTYHTTTDSTGRYTFDLEQDNWVITPFNHVYTFLTESKSGEWGDRDVDSINFEAVNKEPFLPSKHGFRFSNSFSGEPFPRGEQSGKIIARLLKLIGAETETFGLCGGMSASALDFYMTGVPRPEGYYSGPNEGELYNELYYRQFDSLGGQKTVGPVINIVLNHTINYNENSTDLVKLAYWLIQAPDDGEGSMLDMSKTELHSILNYLDNGEIVPIFMVMHKSSEVNWDNFMSHLNNHQVLVYDYEEDTDQSVIHLNIYDPHYPYYHFDLNKGMNKYWADKVIIEIKLDSNRDIVYMRHLIETGMPITHQVHGIYISRHIIGDPHDPTLRIRPEISSQF